MIAYCLRCRKKVEMVEPITRRHTKHNRFVYIGRCRQCGWRTSMIRNEPGNLNKKAPSFDR